MDKTAYHVTTEDQETLVWAVTPIAARVVAVRELGVKDQDIAACCRAPWADEYQRPEWVPNLAKAIHHMHVDCAECGRSITDQYDKGLLSPLGWQDEAFCSQLCIKKFKAHYLPSLEDTHGHQ